MARRPSASGAGLDRDVEVLRPQVDRPRTSSAGAVVASRACSASARERVELAERTCRVGVDLQRRVVLGNAVREAGRRRRKRPPRRPSCSGSRRSVPSSATTSSVPVDAHLQGPPRELERRRPEPAGRLGERDLVVRLAGRGDDELGDAVQRVARAREAVGQGREAHHDQARIHSSSGLAQRSSTPLKRMNRKISAADRAPEREGVGDEQRDHSDDAEDEQPHGRESTRRQWPAPPSIDGSRQPRSSCADGVDRAAAGASAASPTARTSLVPTITPSATAPTCAACSGVPIPKPDRDGHGESALVAAISSPRASGQPLALAGRAGVGDEVDEALGLGADPRAALRRRRRGDQRDQREAGRRAARRRSRLPPRAAGRARSRPPRRRRRAAARTPPAPRARIMFA